MQRNVLALGCDFRIIFEQFLSSAYFEADLVQHSRVDVPGHVVVLEVDEWVGV